MDRLTSMTVFARVAAKRSFSAAARELGMSQATASKHVQTLEGWLGARLLHRTTRRVGLTEAGATFFAQCVHILDDMETARQTGQTAAGLRGNLLIIAPMGFGSIRLAALMVEFMEKNPDLSMTVSVCDRPVDVIEEGYDLAIRVWACPPDDPRLVVHPLLPLRFAVCATPAYLAAYGTPSVPADLARLVCLTDSRYPDGVWRFIGPGGESEVSVGGRLKTDNGLLRREAARSGGGVLLTPEYLVEGDIAAGRLVRLLPGYTPKALRLDAVCPAHRAESPKVRGFVAFLTARLGEQDAAALSGGVLRPLVRSVQSRGRGDEGQAAAHRVVAAVPV
ncbi:MAG TPA: LysR family transcriptional regulator [Acetobacteraceae bacterium]|nr:LysR family transcriptional regulator [Acetobacteraceae bacterium]